MNMTLHTMLDMSHRSMTMTFPSVLLILCMLSVVTCQECEPSHQECEPYKLVDNKFADMTNEEFRSIYLGHKTHERPSSSDILNVTLDKALPASVDWRKQGAVTRIKDQGRCVTMNQYSGKIISPFLPAEDERSLQAAVANQPTSVAIDAGGFNFQLYSRGVFSGYCGQTLNHGVIVVGYGQEDGKKYWLVKNSWGPDWGEEGYIKMERESSDGKGTCGIAMEASFPVKE